MDDLAKMPYAFTILGFFHPKGSHLGKELKWTWELHF